MTVSALAGSSPGAEPVASSAAHWLRIGQEHYAAGRNDDAFAAFQLGLASAEAQPAGSTAAETVSELHSRLGNTCMVRGDLELAAANYKAALRLVPTLASCWSNLGNIHVQTGKPQEAIAYYLEALKLSPRHWPARTNLVQALTATKQYIIAKALLEELLGEQPQDAALRHQLGKVHYELGGSARRDRVFRAGHRAQSARFRQPGTGSAASSRISATTKPPRPPMREQPKSSP